MGKEIKMGEKIFTIWMPLGEVVETNGVYEGVNISINRYEIEVDLRPLELNYFE